MVAEHAEEVAMKWLTRVGIPEQAQKYPGQLSGGQQQRSDCTDIGDGAENSAV